MKHSQIKTIDGNKVYLNNLQVIWNGDSAFAKDIHTRGQTTLNYVRKSYSITLDKKAKIEYSGDSKKMKHLYGLSLTMDKNYINNRLAYGLMSNIGLSGLFYAYGEIRINDSSEGIYLFIERPQDWATKSQNSPFIIRRGYNHKIAKLYTVDDLDKNKEKTYKSNYRGIYSAIKEYQGEELYTQLTKYLDLEMYMQWLAFNYFVHNGDYTDEVYFYINPKDEKFKIIPWDYDDMLSAFPHEGFDKRNAILESKHLFSSEEVLDRVIAKDDYLYALYLEQLNKVLDQLNPEILQKELENIYCELYPFYTNTEIIGQSRYNQFPNANLETLEIEIRSLFEKLVLSRSHLLQK